MVRFRKPLLPEWRYWPAIPLIAIIVAAVVGSAFPPPQKSREYHSNSPASYESAGTDPEERLAEYTLWLTVFTGGLVVTGFLSIWVLFKADRTSRQMAKTAARQAAIARRQLTIAGSQADIQLKQQQIERMQYITTHRPQFELQRIVLEQFEIGKQPKISLIVANEGGSEVRITEMKFAIEVPREGVLEPKRTTERWDDISNDFDIPACAGLPLTVTRMHLLGTIEFDSVFSSPFSVGNIYLISEIEYRDAIGTTREKGFCFLYDRISRRFRSADDPIYCFGS